MHRLTNAVSPKLASLLLAGSLCIAPAAADHPQTDPLFTIESDFQPTPGLPGHSTLTITAVSRVPDQGFRGFSVNASGTFSQVRPFGLETPFQDNNPAFISIGADVLSDTQFLFSTSDIILANPSATLADTVNTLSAAFVLNDVSKTRVPLLQTVSPFIFDEGGDTGRFGYIIEIEALLGGAIGEPVRHRERLVTSENLVGFDRSFYETYVTPFAAVPEPASFGLITVVVLCVTIHRRKPLA